MAVVAVDFDGTLCKFAFPEIGEVEQIHIEVHEIVRICKRRGDIIILWTCRDDRGGRLYLTEALDFCKAYNIPIDYANGYPNPGWEGFKLGEVIPCRKVSADFYIDDHGVNPIHESSIMKLWKANEEIENLKADVKYLREQLDKCV